jgi:hypothetical protein
MDLVIRMAMLAAVQFNGWFRLFAEKIEIIIAYCMLPPEFITAKTPISQPAPNKLFRLGFFLA